MFISPWRLPDHQMAQIQTPFMLRAMTHGFKLSRETLNSNPPPHPTQSPYLTENYISLFKADGQNFLVPFSKTVNRCVGSGFIKEVHSFSFIKGSTIQGSTISVHKIKRCLVLGRKAMTNPDIILKSSNITLPAKVHIVKAMVFPVVMYRWESWTIRKAECQRIDAFKLWCWRRLLRVPWTGQTSKS